MIKFYVGDRVLLTVNPLGHDKVPVTIINSASVNGPPSEPSYTVYRVKFDDGKVFHYTVTAKCLERA